MSRQQRLNRIKQLQEEILAGYKQQNQNRGWECYSDEVGDLVKLQKQLDQIISTQESDVIFSDNSKLRDILVSMNIKSGKYLGLLQDENSSFKNAQRISLKLFKENNYDIEFNKKIEDIVPNIKNNIQKLFELESLHSSDNEKNIEDLTIELHNSTIIGIMILDE